MKKISTIAIISVSAFLASVSRVFAAGIQNPVGFDSVEQILNTYLPLVRLSSTMLFVGVVMYGGFIWINAGDQEDRVATAKKTIIAGIVGFVIIVLAPAIVQFFGALLGVDGGLLSSF